jgi:hypothetical protein
MNLSVGSDVARRIGTATSYESAGRDHGRDHTRDTCTAESFAAVAHFLSLTRRCWCGRAAEIAEFYRILWPLVPARNPTLQQPASPGKHSFRRSRLRTPPNPVYADVSRIICSVVVMPFMTLSHASIRSVSMPSSIAASRISVAPTFCMTSLRMIGDMTSTS